VQVQAAGDLAVRIVSQACTDQAVLHAHHHVLVSWLVGQPTVKITAAAPTLQTKSSPPGVGQLAGAGLNLRVVRLLHILPLHARLGHLCTAQHGQRE